MPSDLESVLRGKASGTNYEQNTEMVIVSKGRENEQCTSSSDLHEL